MQLRVVVCHPDALTEELFQCALLLVDPDAQARIKRFYHRADACRTLIGRILPRMLLKEHGVPPHAMSFGLTEAGKPYITTSALDPPIGYNVSHDNALVAMAFAPGSHSPPAFRVGVDVMRVRLPRRTTFSGLVNTMVDQLTALERLLISGVSESEGLRRFFWIWTLKEAYTKALGLGLGFDFRRIEYNVTEGKVSVDGAQPRGWQFRKFELDEGDELYQGVVAEYVAGEEYTFINEPHGEWITRYDAVSWITEAIRELSQ